MNSATELSGLTRAMPSGVPFWIPFVGYETTTTPEAVTGVGNAVLA